ncbi:hypothetical protein KUCAC02_019323 [Chaenocephalus aceratus]|nr:hypothetical protein KUCAC02_019323 [Chaenocephalus aceratus]
MVPEDRRTAEVISDEHGVEKKKKTDSSEEKKVEKTREEIKEGESMEWGSLSPTTPPPQLRKRTSLQREQRRKRRRKGGRQEQVRREKRHRRVKKPRKGRTERRRKRRILTEKKVEKRKLTGDCPATRTRRKREERKRVVKEKAEEEYRQDLTLRVSVEGGDVKISMMDMLLGVQEQCGIVLGCRGRGGGRECEHTWHMSLKRQFKAERTPLVHHEVVRHMKQKFGHHRSPQAPENNQGSITISARRSSDIVSGEDESSIDAHTVEVAEGVRADAIANKYPFLKTPAGLCEEMNRIHNIENLQHRFREEFLPILPKVLALAKGKSPLEKIYLQAGEESLSEDLPAMDFKAGIVLLPITFKEKVEHHVTLEEGDTPLSTTVTRILNQLY